MTSYLKQFFTTAILFVLFVAVLNWSVDPFSIWHNRCVEGVNCRKSEAGHKIYMTKAYQWRYDVPKTIILGNSRPELGLNPGNHNFDGRSVYNLAIRGAGIVTQVTYLLNLLQYHHPDHVILNIDFIDFIQSPFDDVVWPPVVNDNSYLSLTIDQKKNPHHFLVNLKSRVSSLFSLDTTKASLSTLISQRRQVNYTTLNGFNQADGFLPIINSEGTQALFDQKNKMLLSQLEGKKFDLSDKAGNSSSFTALRLIINELAMRNIKIDLFISPYHISYLDVLSKTENYSLFLRWKKELVEVLTQINYFEKSSLFDFSGFNKYTQESIPAKRGVVMKWYWESSHYRAELGDVIIEHILKNENYFQLGPWNLEAHLAREKELMDNRKPLMLTQRTES